MERYVPSQTPDSAEWLALDEQERIILVEEFHLNECIDLPNASAHATFHVIVENQLAEGDEPVVRALARLMKQGLPRHDAIHAIGSAVGEQIYDLLNREDTPEASRARYYAAVERLTAAAWLRYHDD